MIGYGILFLLNTLFHLLTYTEIFSLWPLLLIALGAEMLISNAKYSDTERFNLVYDKGAVFLTALVTLFAVGMGVVDYGMQCVARYGLHTYI
jgi:cytochrome c oxidase subunit IV